MIAVDVLPLLEAEAKERQGTRTDISAKLHEGSRSDTNAGKALGVSGRMVSDAKAIREKEPELALFIGREEAKGISFPRQSFAWSTVTHRH